MRSFLFLFLLSLLLLTPAYVSFRRKMRRVMSEVLGIRRRNEEARRDYIREGPGQNIRIFGIPFVYIVIILIMLWGVAVAHYVYTTMMN